MKLVHKSQALRLPVADREEVTVHMNPRDADVHRLRPGTIVRWIRAAARKRIPTQQYLRQQISRLYPNGEPAGFIPRGAQMGPINLVPSLEVRFCKPARANRS